MAERRMRLPGTAAGAIGAGEGKSDFSGGGEYGPKAVFKEAVRA